MSYAQSKANDVNSFCFMSMFSLMLQVPRSVYAAVPGRNKYRPSQQTPIPNFTLAGDWTSQKFLGSMEGAVLAGKLAAEVVSDKAAGLPTKCAPQQHHQLKASMAFFTASSATRSQCQTPSKHMKYSILNIYLTCNPPKG
jgi:hypothetical protein